MTRTISITGIDGTGKTTVIRALSRRFSGREGFAAAFRAPQFHESGQVAHAELSAHIDALSRLGDRRRDLGLKACSLFLSMTLYGDVQRELTRRVHPRFLFGERQPLLDSLVYALYYTKLLSAPLDQATLGPVIEGELGSAGFARIAAWLEFLASRDPEIGGRIEDFWKLPLFARRLFELPVQELLERLMILYAVEEPSELVLLSVSPERLEQRLAEKRGSGTEPELHERKDVLERLQLGMRSALLALGQAFPRLKVHEVETSELSIEESCDRIVALVGAASEATESPRA